MSEHYLLDMQLRSGSLYFVTVKEVQFATITRNIADAVASIFQRN